MKIRCFGGWRKNTEIIYEYMSVFIDFFCILKVFPINASLDDKVDAKIKLIRPLLVELSNFEVDVFLKW
jgi:hypothetical protein